MDELQKKPWLPKYLQARIVRRIQTTLHRKLVIEHFRLHQRVYKLCITLSAHIRGQAALVYFQLGIRSVVNALMACVFPRLDPALAYPVPLRPSVFQHARFIDKMQPSVARVKQEKFEGGYQEEPLSEGMSIIRQFSAASLGCPRWMKVSSIKMRF